MRQQNQLYYRIVTISVLFLQGLGHSAIVMSLRNYFLLILVCNQCLKQTTNDSYHKPQQTHRQDHYCKVQGRHNQLMLHQRKAHIWHTLDNSVLHTDPDDLKNKGKELGKLLFYQYIGTFELRTVQIFTSVPNTQKQSPLCNGLAE